MTVIWSPCRRRVIEKVEGLIKKLTDTPQKAWSLRLTFSGILKTVKYVNIRPISGRLAKKVYKQYSKILRNLRSEQFFQLNFKVFYSNFLSSFQYLFNIYKL